VGIRRLTSDTILVGLRRVGLVGLREALRKVNEEPRPAGDAALDRLLEILRRRNYIPEEHEPAYRRALGRELLRSRGQEFRALLEEIPVTLRGTDGEERLRLQEDLAAVLEEMDLRPILALEPPGPGPTPQVLIGGEIVQRGPASRPQLRAAVARTLTDW
jgi:hypothetical protein